MNNALEDLLFSFLVEVRDKGGSFYLWFWFRACTSVAFIEFMLSIAGEFGSIYSRGEEEDDETGLLFRQLRISYPRELYEKLRILLAKKKFHLMRQSAPEKLF